jgi:hypothetical protein
MFSGCVEKVSVVAFVCRVGDFKRTSVYQKIYIPYWAYFILASLSYIKIKKRVGLIGSG